MDILVYGVGQTPLYSELTEEFIVLYLNINARYRKTH